MSLTDEPIGCAIVDAATGKSELFVDRETTLTLTFANNSGEDIELVAGPHPATLSAFFPNPQLFTSEQLQAITVSADDWSGAYDSAQKAMVLSATVPGTWKAGGELRFTLAGARSSGPPYNASVEILPEQMEGDIPLSVYAEIVLARPPVPGNRSLLDTLDVTLDDQGIVYRSPSSKDPLTNRLFLTIKNKLPTAVCESDTPIGTPQVLMAFVYGNTSGSLAPDTGTGTHNPPRGSAWNIKATVAVAGSPWGTRNPRSDGQQPHPEWVLEPTSAAILGPAGTDSANVTFVLDPVVAATPVGHTQVLLLFTGFHKDADTGYDDHLFVVDINKLEPPPTRGLLSFFGPDPVIGVPAPDTPVSVDLRWSMFHVARVALLTSAPSVPPWGERYENPEPLNYSTTQVTVPAPRSSEAIFMTLQAFDGNDGYLNSLQFTAYAQVRYLVDGDRNIYPIALFGDTFWMCESYRFQVPTGAYEYDVPPNQSDPLVKQFGRLYDYAAANANAPKGWELPSVADWRALIDRYGADAYTALTPGGESGFNGQLGGRRAIDSNNRGRFEHRYSYGYHWTAGGALSAQFSSASKSVSVATPVSNPATALSVRYIQRA
jgi:uncharacterized protein (TIGR02145 family)